MITHVTKSFSRRSLVLALLALGCSLGVGAQQTRTAFEFSRPIDTCDEGGDRAIEGTSRIIYSWNDEDPADAASPSYHGPGQRGTQSVNVVAPQPDFPIVEDDIITIQLNNSMHTVREGINTMYYCKVFELPSDQTYHIVSFDMVINEANSANVHHALLLECPEVEAAGGIDGDGLVDGEQNPCGGGLGIGGDEDEAHTHGGCQSNGVVWAWAIGGGGNILPPNVGYPVGAGETRTFMIQMHYDIPDQGGITDDSGMELKLTPSLREQDAAVMQVGELGLATSIIIPPGEENFQVNGYCPKEGLGPAIASNTSTGSLTLFSAFLHAHLSGRHITLRHSRNGVELPVIAEDPNYDFAYQEYMWFDEPVTMLPEDDLHVNCFYDTTDRINETLGGEGTYDEMCLAFIMYYPRLPDGSNCVTIPASDTLSVFFANGNVNSRTVVTTPVITTPYVEENPCTGNEEHPRFGSSVAMPLEARTIGEWRASFENSRALVADNAQYMMYWTTDSDNETVRFGIDVATTGWAGFGFSPNGGMVGGDVIMAWVDDDSQELFFADRMAAARAPPEIDENQDYFGIRGVQYTEVCHPVSGECRFLQECASHEHCPENSFCGSQGVCRRCLGGHCAGGDDTGDDAAVLMSGDGTNASSATESTGVEEWVVVVACLAGLVVGALVAAVACSARSKRDKAASGSTTAGPTSTQVELGDVSEGSA